MRGCLLDSSFVFALYGREGDRTRRAEDNFGNIISRSGNVVLVPWPILYESFNTEFSGDHRQIARLDSEWAHLEKLGRLEFLDDAPFRSGVLANWRRAEPKEEKKRKQRARGLSLVDRILMAIIEEGTISVEAILTFDRNDFRGFCARRNIEIIPGA